MTDSAQVYSALRERVCDVVRTADDESLERRAPAAPEWRVRDLLAHVSGVAADVNARNLDGVATDAWTARQVDSRRGWSIDRIVDEWNTEGRKVEAIMSKMPQVAVGQMLFDAVTHEHDIRGGLERPGARDSDALTAAMDWGVPGLAMNAEPADVTLRVESDDGTATVGSGNRHIGLRVDRFELFRAMTGRRSVEQMQAFRWEGEAAPELLVLPIFTPRPTPLVE